MRRGRVRGWLLGLLLLASLVSLALPASAAHKPIYKSSIDRLDPDGWEAHFVWLRSDYFNYVGKVYWEWEAQGEVDVLFLDWPSFQAFREGGSYRAMVDAAMAPSGAQGLEDLTTDIPYFLVLRNPGPSPIEVEWYLYAEIDWRRWDPVNPLPPGPTLNLAFVDGSPLLARTETWEMAFTEPGHYLYFCDPHADMTALVEVVAAASPDPDVDVAIHDFGFHPEFLRVAQGTTLRWVNQDGVGHSVQVERLVDGIPSDAGPIDAPSPLLRWWPLALVPVGGVAVFLVYRRTRRA